MSTNPPPSAFPPSMGPGAQTTHNPPDPADMVRQIREMRKHYQVEVDSSNLTVGYSINGQQRKYVIPFSAAPLSTFQQGLLYGGRVRSTISATFLLDMIRGAENMIGRPLTQREAEAFTLHSGNRMKYGFVGMGVALATGYGMAYRGFKTMKFPFKKVKPIESYDAFPANRMPLLTGAAARTAWQTTRFNIYAALGIIFLSPIFRSMGESIMAVGLYRDERTRETVKAIKGGFDRIRMNRRQPGSAPPSQTQSQQSSEDSDNQDFYGSDGASTQSDYSRNMNDGGDRAFTDSTTDTGAMSDSAMRRRESAQSSPASYGNQRNPNRYQRPQSSEQASSSSPTDFFYDDASPTAGNDPDMSQPRYNQSNSQGGGSVWSQIRRSGRTGSNPAPSPSEPQSQDFYPESSSSSSSTTRTQTTGESGSWRRPGASPGAGGSSDFETRGDSFSFSSSDEQRALAKTQAQREFDAMLERERKDSGSDDYSRGSFAAEAGSENPRDAGTGGAGGSGSSAWDRRRRGN